MFAGKVVCLYFILIYLSYRLDITNSFIHLYVLSGISVAFRYFGAFRYCLL